MQARDFVFWLQGAFELCDVKSFDERQTNIIKQHLNLVFIHEIDPSHSDDPVVQGALQAVHDGVNPNELRSQLDAMKAERAESKQVDRRGQRPSGGSIGNRMMC